ncbi:MAG: hypothetical protein WBD93_21685, partial [Acidobacteriaceae bacterium]
MRSLFRLYPRLSACGFVTIRILLAGMLLFLPVPSMTAQSSSAPAAPSWGGVVRDAGGHPIAAATVTLTGAAT